MALGLAIFGGVFWFIFVALILYSKSSPEGQVRRRLNMMIEAAEALRIMKKVMSNFFRRKIFLKELYDR